MNIKLLNEDATTPEYKTSGAGCFDLASSKKVPWQAVHIGEVNDYPIGWQVVIPLGIAFEIPGGYTMKIYPRSGWGFKHNIQLANGTGIIDSDYRGEVMVKLIAFCDKKDLPKIEVGTRVAQAEITQGFRVQFDEVDELSVTERGEGGFGSTGA